jgi:hypothetical protein
VSTLHTVHLTQYLVSIQQCPPYTLSILHSISSLSNSVHLTHCPCYTVSRLYPKVSTLHTVHLTQYLVSIQQCPPCTLSTLHSISSLSNSVHLTQCPPYTVSTLQCPPYTVSTLHSTPLHFIPQKRNYGKPVFTNSHYPSKFTLFPENIHFRSQTLYAYTLIQRSDSRGPVMATWRPPDVKYHSISGPPSLSVLLSLSARDDRRTTVSDDSRWLVYNI